ncbi:MAG: transporter related [Chthoniobacteraceae bacterium]|nr:transporter related [Chthoniobacteraceae bacterium]
MGNNVVIKVENLGKSYQINSRKTESYTALRDVAARMAVSPFRKIRSLMAGNSSNTGGLRRSDTTAEAFWALRDVSFTVKQGEVIGIIGRNGAGKSTLLKILSRITEPSNGRVQIKGRVASLLEVGTGFHPELSGRENIFLNGAILGMSRAEIKSKFDEIVEFAEVEKFLDTPVKRYSSGMYVRLAFGVAAHLEPEILVVDEVLAVGDAEFQKKCIGKMSDVARGGRTVLFVSHNMAAVKSLTTTGLVLQAGKVAFSGSSDESIDFYTRSINSQNTGHDRNLGSGSHTTVKQVRLLDNAGVAVSHYNPGSPLILEITFQTDGTAALSIEAFLLDSTRSKLALASLHQFHGTSLPGRPGIYVFRLILEPLWLASGRYSLDITTSLVNSGWDHYIEDAIDFDVITSNPLGHPWDFKQSYGYGAFAMLCRESPVFTQIE